MGRAYGTAPSNVWPSGRPGRPSVGRGEARRTRMRARSMTTRFILAVRVVGLAGRASGAAAAASADLGLAMTTDPTVVSVGGATTFTVVVSNNGPPRPGR